MSVLGRLLGIHVTHFHSYYIEVTAKGTFWKMTKAFFPSPKCSQTLNQLGIYSPFPTRWYNKVGAIGYLRLSRIKWYLYIWSISKFEHATVSERQSCRCSSQQLHMSHSIQVIKQKHTLEHFCFRDHQNLYIRGSYGCQKSKLYQKILRVVCVDPSWSPTLWPNFT